MEETYTLGLCLLDLVPNLAFLVAAYFLVRLTLLDRGRASTWLMMVGTALVFLGGTLKAVWKLLYTTGVGDISIMSEAQFVLLAPGFLAMLISVILLARGQRRPAHGAALAMAPWKIPFLAVMTLSSLGTQGTLAFLSIRRGARLAAVLFIVAIICMLGMAGMASGEQSVAQQWLEEGINTFGQLSFALGSYLLYRRSRDVAVVA